MTRYYINREWAWWKIAGPAAVGEKSIITMYVSQHFFRLTLPLNFLFHTPSIIITRANNLWSVTRFVHNIVLDADTQTQTFFLL